MRIKPFEFYQLIIDDENDCFTLNPTECEEGEGLEVLVEYLIYLLSEGYVYQRG